MLFSYDGPDTGNVGLTTATTTIPMNILQPTLAGAVTVNNQILPNGVAVTANSTINITNSLTATVGPASLGAATLNVTSSDGRGSPYNLTFTGASTLTGNATVNVANSSGGGTGRVNLSALGETGGSQSLTKTGPGVLALTGAGTYSGGTVLSPSTGSSS